MSAPWLTWQVMCVYIPKSSQNTKDNIQQAIIRTRAWEKQWVKF